LETARAVVGDKQRQQIERLRRQVNFVAVRKELPRVLVEGETAEAMAHAASRSAGSLNVPRSQATRVL
jgi:hypothetical protein